MCKGGSNTTQTSTTGPPPQVLQNYQDVYSQAANLAASGLGAQTYPGQTVAPFSSNQEWAINNPFAAQQVYGGYANTGQNYYQAATQPLWNQGVSSAFQEPINIAGQNLGAATQANLSPYIQSVVDATQAQFNNQNAIQQQGVIGNAISSNAWGGDRSGVAQGITAGQQQLAEAPVIAGLYNQGYQTAQQATLAQMQQQEAAGEAGAQAQLGAGEANAWLNSQAAAGMSNIGATEAGLVQGALSNATQLGALQQQQAQANLNVPYANWLQQTSYPYQATNWLANITEGIGGLSGGTGTTTTPGPSTGSQIAGLGIGGVGLLGSTGAFGKNGYLTGTGGLFGSQGPLFGNTADASIAAGGAPLSLPFRGGGGIRGYQVGGSPKPLSSPTALPMGSGLPMGDTIPNLSVSIVPQTSTPTASRSPFIGLGPQTTTQTQQSGSGGLLGGLGSAVSTGLGIAKLATLFDRGGGIHDYDEGGDVGFDTLPEVNNVGDPFAPSAGMPPPMYGGAPGTHLTPSEGIAPYHADPWMALAAAGFGAAAGRSPHALQNIGQGGLEGMNFYESQRRYEPEARLKGAQATQAEIQAGLTKAAVQYYQNSRKDDLSSLVDNVAAGQKQQSAPASVAASPLPADQVGFHALLPIETKGDPNAVSPKGAVGLSQIMPDTAKEYLGRDVSPEELKNPQFNLQLGQTIYSDLLKRYNGDHDIAAVAYNAGKGVGDKYQQSGKDPKVLPAETQHYVQMAQNNRAEIANDAGQPPQVRQIPVGNTGQTVSVPSSIGDGRYPILDQQYARILKALGSPLIWTNPAAQAAQESNLARVYDQDPRMQANKAAEILRAQKGVEFQMNPRIAAATKKAEIPAVAETAGAETTARTGAEPQSYILPGGAESVAPRSQVLAGTAPGMGAPPGAGGPAGKYDPDPQSLAGPVPGGPPITKLALGDAKRFNDDAEEYKEYRIASETTPQTIQRTGELKDILQRLNTGRTLEAGHDFLAWARSAGLESLIPKGYDPSDAEMVNKLATSLVFEQLKAIGGRPMVAEIQGLQSANANISLTPKANLDIVGNIEGGAKYTKDRFLQASQVWTKYHQLGNFDEKYLSNSPLGEIFKDAKQGMLNGQTSASNVLGQFPDAKRAPDGSWVVLDNPQKPYDASTNKYHRVNVPQ